MKGNLIFALTRPHRDDWLIGMEFVPEVTIRLGDNEVSGTLFSIGLLIFRIDYLKPFNN